MVYYSSLNFTSSDVGAAIAKAVIFDIQINNLSLEGFPQISVGRLRDDNFELSLKFDNKVQIFTITKLEAVNAVNSMKNDEYCKIIFPRIQNALAELERSSTKPS